MVSINDIIQREVNPFDLINTKVGNFWTDNSDAKMIVASIHQQQINEIEDILNLVTKDNRSRTILLIGDAGCGKSYLLGRLKKTFNPKAFFVYIGPWADNEHIWRHILRNTVDSLIHVPDGQQESQLILWLKSLSAFTKSNGGVWQGLLNDRQKFIKHLKKTYKTAGIYNADMFFGVLHDLTNPELYDLACEWLRGDSISEESMQELKVRFCIDTEDAAKNILANFSKISLQTQPIVLCFDQVETTPNYDVNPLPLFNINTTIHNDNFKNFLIIITIIKDHWMRTRNSISQADKARIEKLVQLKSINLEQAKAIWNCSLLPLHIQANPAPPTSTFPLDIKLLPVTFPGNKTYPRQTIILGRKEYQHYKERLILDRFAENKERNGASSPDEVETISQQELQAVIENSHKISPQAEFEILWQKELQKNQEEITKILFVASVDFIEMLDLALQALKMKSVKTKLLTGSYSNQSLSFQSLHQGQVGIVCTEDLQMHSFYAIMNATHKVIQKGICQHIYLIRVSGVGNAKLKGYQIYSQIFDGNKNVHIYPDLASIHILQTYRNLVRSCESQELVIGGETVRFRELENFVRTSKFLEECTILQKLGVVTKVKTETVKDLRPVKEFMLNLVKTQSFMGVPALYRDAREMFKHVTEEEIKHLINLLCEERKIKFINPKEVFEKQLVCLVP